MRGDIVIARMLRDKARPAIVINDDVYAALPRLAIIPLTTETHGLWPLIEPSSENGLLEQSRAMIDRLGTLDKSKIHSTTGRLSSDDLAKLDAALSEYLGLG